MVKIILDPGHGRYGNQSPVNKTYYEGTQMWKLSRFLKSELEEFGFEVVTTRPNLADNPSLSERGGLAKGSDMILSLHSNAPGRNADGTYPTSATGTVVYYSMADQNNKVLADKLGQKVSETIGHNFRGSKTREYPDRPGVDYYGVIRAAVASGCKEAFIIEHGFHTNKKDSDFLLEDYNLKRLATEEAVIVAEHFGVEKQSDDVLYRVQTGAFTKKDNADALLVKVKAAGFDTYMVKVNDLYKIQVGAYSKKSNADAMAEKLKAAGFETYITTNSGTSVKAETPKIEIKVGDKVKVRSGAKTYTGGGLSSRVYKTKYDVIQTNGDRVVIGLGKAVTAAVNVKDLILQ